MIMQTVMLMMKSLNKVVKVLQVKIWDIRSSIIVPEDLERMFPETLNIKKRHYKKSSNRITMLKGFLKTFNNQR